MDLFKCFRTSKQALRNLKDNYEVMLRWVPGRSHTEGNEIWKELVKQGSSIEGIKQN